MSPCNDSKPRAIHLAISVISRLCDHGVPPGGRLDGEYLLLLLILLLLQMARLLLVQRPLELPQLVHVHRSPTQHALRLVVHLRHVLEVDSPVVLVESGGLDWARSAGGLIPL